MKQKYTISQAVREKRENPHRWVHAPCNTSDYCRFHNDAPWDRAARSWCATRCPSTAVSAPCPTSSAACTTSTCDAWSAATRTYRSGPSAAFPREAISGCRRLPEVSCTRLCRCSRKVCKYYHPRTDKLLSLYCTWRRRLFIMRETVSLVCNWNKCKVFYRSSRATAVSSKDILQFRVMYESKIQT